MLLSLNSDPANIGDIAMWLYNKDKLFNRNNVVSLAQSAKDAGWEIRRKNKCYTISEKHYTLIDANQDIIKAWPWGRMLTPESVSIESAR